MQFTETPRARLRGVSGKNGVVHESGGSVQRLQSLLICIDPFLNGPLQNGHPNIAQRLLFRAVI